MQVRGATAGWVIGVMVEEAGEPAARHYFAVGKPDQQRAEWAAVDLAVQAGRVAVSPIGGIEPVQAIVALTAAAMARLGLAAGTATALGRRLPRRWLGG
jgi:hypothetical protein